MQERIQKVMSMIALNPKYIPADITAGMSDKITHSMIRFVVMLDLMCGEGEILKIFNVQFSFQFVFDVNNLAS